MRRRRIMFVLFLASTAVTSGFAMAAGCSATKQSTSTGGSEGTGGSTSSGGQGGTTGGNGGEGATIIIDDGGMDVNNDAPMNPCGTRCGDLERCDPDHLGLDDDCDGQVDEICDCSAGSAHSCFKGDPSYLSSPSCFPGTMKCTENGQWGPCVGGVHATDDQKCYEVDLAACHPIVAVPFQDVNLKDGTGTFSADAVPGSEVWTVTCPAGV